MAGDGDAHDEAVELATETETRSATLHSARST